MRVLLVGDVMLGRLVNEVLRRRPMEYPWGNTLPLFRSTDLRICNLECVISDLGEPWTLTPKAFHFRSDARNVDVLTAAGIDVVSLANNHALDYGREAMLDMCRTLDAAGVAHVGAGADTAEAQELAVVEVDGTAVGVLSFTDNEPVWEAGEDRPGVHHVPTSLADPRTRALLEQVRRAKESVDLLIVSAHWGGNWGQYPPREHISLGQALVDHGADVIHGHSCHVFRGIEFHAGRPILHSTGDFVDDYAVHETERNDWSFIFLVEMEDGVPLRLLLVPTVIDAFQARLAEGAEREEIVARMKELCLQLNTPSHWRADEGHLEIPVVQHR